MSTAAATHVVSDDALIALAAKLPASPAILAEFNELTLDPHMVIDEATALLRRDSTLAAGVVRVSNSPVYGGDRISAVEDAVARVGLKEVYRLVSLATTARLAELAMPTYGVFVGRLAKSTLLHGVAAETLAAECGLDRRVAYTAALVRMLGMRIVDAVARNADWIGVAATSDLVGWERQTFGRTNPEVAEVVLRHWRFGEDVIEAVREQYLEEGPEAASLMAVLVNVAGSFVVGADAAVLGEVPLWRASLEKLAVLGLKPEKLEALQEPIMEEFERLLEAFA
ncbi:HDOD domain-containing protein [Actomonas aquatica]|uniref:HDOD domain-containing protein n=1 Tax=Actomonas aquatica TaxID=2866162 RepID=A0ABZ1CE09_9BACT|nr:HDOD domain-containing protein [Opitutus sp. WL0086]WRQ89794.1 HDOD domain-containing protein [Opitutus sp. WL0086]